MDEEEDIMDAGLICDPNLSLGITWPLRTLDWPSVDLPGRSCEWNVAEEGRKETVRGLLWLLLAEALSLFSVSTNPAHEYKPPGARRQRRSRRVFVWNVYSISNGFGVKRPWDQNKAICLFSVTKWLCIWYLFVLSSRERFRPAAVTKPSELPT